MTTQILVVDDELGIRNLLTEILDDEGYDVYSAEDAAHAREIIQQHDFDLILLDIWMPDTDGVTLLKEWGSTHAINCPVVMMSGHGTIETAMEATRFGAVDFLEKPIALKRLLETCRRVLAEWKYRQSIKAASRPEPVAQPAEQPPAQTAAQQSAQLEPAPAPASGIPSGQAVAAYTVVQPEATGPGAQLPVVEIPSLGLVLDFNRGLRELRDDLERAYLTRVLRMKGGSISLLSKHSQLERTHLYRKLKSLGINPNELTGPANRDKPLPVYGRRSDQS